MRVKLLGMDLILIKFLGRKMTSLKNGHSSVAVLFSTLYILMNTHYLKVGNSFLQDFIGVFLSAFS